MKQYNFVFYTTDPVTDDTLGYTERTIWAPDRASAWETARKWAYNNGYNDFDRKWAYNNGYNDFEEDNMKYYTIRFWNNLKQKEFSILAKDKHQARQLAIDVIGIHPDSIIQIKEATE